MKRWLLPAALLLSLGFNFGLLASYLAGRPAAFEKRQVEPAPESTDAGRVLAPGEPEPATTIASPEPESLEEAVEPLVLVPEPASEPTPQTVSPAPPETRGSPESQTQEPTQPAQAPPRAPAQNSAQMQEPDDPSEQPARPGFGAARRLGQRTDFEQMADRLELSGAQREKFLADHLEFSSRVRRIAPRTLRLRRAFFAELSAAQPDEEKIKRLTQQLGAANVALERALADVVLKTRSHLDVAKQQQYLRYVQSRMQRLQEFVQNGGQRRRQGAGQGPRGRRRPNARPPGF